VPDPELAERAGLDIGEELDRQGQLNVPIGLLKRLAPDPVPLFLTGRFCDLGHLGFRWVRLV